MYREKFLFKCLGLPFFQELFNFDLQWQFYDLIFIGLKKMKLNSKFSMIVALTVLQVAFLTIISFSGLNKMIQIKNLYFNWTK